MHGSSTKITQKGSIFSEFVINYTKLMFKYLAVSVRLITHGSERTAKVQSIKMLGYRSRFSEAINVDINLVQRRL